jgi:hypothetical protein
MQESCDFTILRAGTLASFKVAIVVLNCEDDYLRNVSSFVAILRIGQGPPQ